MAQPANLAIPSWNARPYTTALARPRAVGAVEAASFEAHPDAQFVVQPGGEPLAANRAGRELIARSASVRVLADGLVAGTSARIRLLRERIAETVRSQLSSPELEIPTAESSTLAIRVLPLGANLGAALLIIREREAQPAGSASLRFGFTPAESRVANLLARSLTVPQIALQLGISIETVRCHLKQAFSKARVHRQAELVAVMLLG